ncbi:MAG: hypothetical protein GY863_22600 [bacterium]|nr:hypothetical protein [bacterium]
MIYLVRKEESNNAGRKINCVVLKDPEELKHVRKKNVRISGSRIRKRERCRIFLFGNEREKRIVEQMEDCGGRLGDHIRFYSGLIGRKGRKSIVINDISPESCYTDRGMLIESGRDLEREKLVFTGHYIVHDPALYKSGYDIRKYVEPKIFLNQTGDRLKAFYDDRGFFCLNNLHVGYSIDQDTDLRFVAFLLNCRVMNFYYKTTSMEHGRALAQTDIDFLHELPFCRDREIPRKITGILNRHLKSDTQIYSSDHIEYTIKLPPKYGKMIEDLFCEWYGVTIPEDFGD